MFLLKNTLSMENDNSNEISKEDNIANNLQNLAQLKKRIARQEAGSIPRIPRGDSTWAPTPEETQAFQQTAQR